MGLSLMGAQSCQQLHLQLCHTLQLGAISDAADTHSGILLGALYKSSMNLLFSLSQRLPAFQKTVSVEGAFLGGHCKISSEHEALCSLQTEVYDTTPTFFWIPFMMTKPHYVGVKGKCYPHCHKIRE